MKAHEFPITTLRFNPSSRLLVSGGTDATIRIIAIPEKLGGLREPFHLLLPIFFFDILCSVEHDPLDPLRSSSGRHRCDVAQMIPSTVDKDTLSVSMGSGLVSYLL